MDNSLRELKGTSKERTSSMTQGEKLLGMKGFEFYLIAMGAEKIHQKKVDGTFGYRQMTLNMYRKLEEY